MKDEQRIEIQRLAHGGDGIGYLEDGRIVFVPTTLPGEVVDVELVELKKTYGKARLVEVVEASAARVEPDCPYFPSCGGCQFWHADYAEESERKSSAAWETISRISHLEDLPEAAMIPAPRDRRYRTRVTFHRQRADEGAGWTIGFYGARSGDVIAVEDCMITAPLLNDARRRVEPALRDVGDADLILETASDDTVVATLVPERNFGTKMPPSLKSFVDRVDQNPLFRGFRVVGDTEDVVFGDITVDAGQVLARPPVDAAQLPSANFRQNYPAMNRRLVDEVVECVGDIGARSAVELFCGNGNLSFALSDQLERLVGLEANEAAVVSASGLAELTHLDGYEFRVADLSDGFVDQLDDPVDDFDLVVLDPPRSGAPKVCAELADANVDAIVYVSCDPACLGRDLKKLSAGGWEVDALTMLDLFPRTGHIETIAVLTKS